MDHLGTVRIETDRTVLRRFTTDDAEYMFKNWAGDDAVTKYLTWPTHSGADESRRVIRMWEEKYGSPDNYQWCIELKSTKEAIGSISAVDVNEKLNAVEIGYCIGREFWGRGITTEALGALIEFFFEKVKVNRIAAKHDLNNPASGRVMQKCGLIKEGTLRQAGFNNTGVCDLVIYGLVKADRKKGE